jgi:ribosomal protein S18 acetylase RimI-like enzyme
MTPALSAICAERGNIATREAAGIWARATARRGRLPAVPRVEDKLPAIESALASDGALLLVSRVEGEAMAFAVVIPRIDVLELLYLAVDPAAWGRGLARQLLDYLRHLSAKKNTSMELWVIADNSRAIASYESAGWTRTADIRVRNSSGRPERRYILTH